ncbi:MAG TPA: host attachment family protein [Pseudolabrys sp.]|jgi:protein required for attachment to host cells
MLELRIHKGEWVVVCDGAKALVLENVGDVKFPNLKTIEVFEHKSVATRDLGADKPGRSHSSSGAGSSTVEQTDWHEQEERAFLLQLAKHLDAAIGAGKIKSLIVAAPPRALGVLRSAYTQRLRDAVSAEVDKDFVKLPVHQIEKQLTGA